MALFFIPKDTIKIDKVYQANVCYPVTGANARGVKIAQDSKKVTMSQKYVSQAEIQKSFSTKKAPNKKKTSQAGAETESTKKEENSL